MAPSERFYSDLPVFESFDAITDTSNYTECPEDWSVVITDVKGSTQAVKEGRYKEVNLLGASSITAMLNLSADLDIPFVFGGDGATLLIPPSLLAQAKIALVGTQEMATAQFSMELRVGIVPLSHIRSAGFTVKVAKVRISPQYEQAMFIGGGLSFAEKCVKDLATAPEFAVKIEPGSTERAKANFDGLECRWRDVPNKLGETHSLLVLAEAAQPEKSAEIYKSVLAKIASIYGNSDEQNPISSDFLNLSFSPKRLSSEVKVKNSREGGCRLLRQTILTLFENLAGFFLLFFRVNTKGTDWGKYQQDVAANADFKKFDDMLRMTLAGDESRRAKLCEWLESQKKEGKLVYGIQTGKGALLTCLVFDRRGRHFHFVDGSDGGYTLAAKGLKAQLQLKSSTR